MPVEGPPAKKARNSAANNAASQQSRAKTAGCMRMIQELTTRMDALTARVEQLEPLASIPGLEPCLDERISTVEKRVRKLWTRRAQIEPAPLYVPVPSLDINALPPSRSPKLRMINGEDAPLRRAW